MQGLDLIEPFLAELIRCHDAGPGNRAYVVIQKKDELPEPLICTLRVDGEPRILEKSDTLFGLLYAMAGPGTTRTVLSTQRKHLLAADAEIPPGTWVIRPVGDSLKIGSPGTPQTWTLSDLLKT